MAALSDFTYFNNRSLGGIGAEELNDPRTQQALAAIRQYDPNANFRPTYGSDGQLTGYTLDVDASKLPGVSGTGSLGGTSGHGSGADYAPNFSTVQQNMSLLNPSAVSNSPIYGQITQNSNIEQPRSWVDVVGPMIPLAFAALGAAGYLPAWGDVAGAGTDLSGLGASDPFLQGGTGAMDMTGSVGTGLPGSEGLGIGGSNWGMFDRGLGTTVNGGLGSGSEGTLSAADIAQLGNGAQAAAPIVDQSTQARASDIARIATGIDPSAVASALRTAGGLLGGATGGAGGGSGGGGGLLAIAPRQPQSYDNLTAILRRFYGGANG